jgi:DNA repair photolyase
MSTPLPGRGAASDPPNRFIPLNYEPSEDHDPALDPAPRTQFFLDTSRSALNANDSPDIPFTYSLNPYRGCEHGCVYCYARPTHEYLSFSCGLDFETRIMVKRELPALLRKSFLAKSWEPQPIAVGAVTDPYQPAERRFQITRRCLEVCVEFRNPVGIVTKNSMVVRDQDLLTDLHRDRAAAVFVSVTTLDADLARRLEPRASAPAARLRAIRDLADAGIPTGVMFAPVIPGLNDHEVADVLSAAREAGATAAGYTVVRLPFGVKALFEEWLETHFPERKDKVLGRIRETRGGALNDPRFGTRMTGEGPWADAFRGLFRVARTRQGFRERLPALNSAAFRRPGSQPTLFDT